MTAANRPDGGWRMQVNNGEVMLRHAVWDVVAYHNTDADGLMKWRVFVPHPNPANPYGDTHIEIAGGVVQEDDGAPLPTGPMMHAIISQWNLRMC